MKQILFFMIIAALGFACGPQSAATSGTKGAVGIPALNWSDVSYYEFRKIDAGTGEWCSHKGSLKIIADFNEDGIEDQFCKDDSGVEAVINGARLLYGYPALRSRTQGTFCAPETYPKLYFFAHSKQSRRFGCGIFNETYFILDSHAVLKDLF